MPKNSADTDGITDSVFIAIVGRPNVGKSTLLNAMCGGKHSIVSNRQQTTRSLVRAVSDADGIQMVWLDTPGWQLRHRSPFNSHLNRTVEHILADTDSIVFMTAAPWTPTDAQLLKRLPTDKPIIGIINKTDLFKDRNHALTHLSHLSQQADFAELIPISAKKRRGITVLKKILRAYAKPSPPRFWAQADDRDFFFAELVRESVFHHLGDELPYVIGVIARSQPTETVLKVSVNIYAEKESQKRILIGKNGQQLQKIARKARLNMQVNSRQKIFMDTRVKVHPWKNDAQLLKQMRII